MPIPKRVGRLNRRVLNPIMRTFAGRVPPLAILIHRGRTSGRTYRIPMMVFPAGDGFVIALTYGRGTDWERNVFAAGGCGLVYRGREHMLLEPVLITAREASVHLPTAVRGMLSLLGVNQFIRLREAASSDGPPPTRLDS